MSDVPQDLDLTQLSSKGAPAEVAHPPKQPQTRSVSAAASSVAVQVTVPSQIMPVMQSPEVPYPVAAPVNPGDPAPTINHYPWTPLPLAPVDIPPVPKLDIPTDPVVIAAPVVPARPAQSLAAPAPDPEPVPEPAPDPVPQPTPQPTPPAPRPIQIATPPAEARRPVTPPEVAHVDIEHIYSFSTQEVWRALRPSRAYGLFVVVSVSAVGFLAFVLLQSSGVSLYEIPFIKDMLGL